MDEVEIAGQNESIVFSAGQRVQGMFSRIERELLERILAHLKRYPTQGGRFKPDETARQILLELRRELAGLVTRRQVNRVLDSLLVDFDALGQNVRALHGEANDITVPLRLLDENRVAVVNETANSMFSTGYDARFAEPVQKVLFNHINFGASISDTERAVRALVTGGPDNLGLLSRWSGQVARDSLGDYQGRVHKEVKTQYRLTLNRYVGNIIRDSRWQCRRWVEKGYLRDDELAAEIRLAYRRGSGMRPGTTPATFIIVRGGYNCMHTVYPVRSK